MKSVVMLLSVFFCVSAFAESSSVRTQTFIDRVHQIKTTSEKHIIIFHREPVLYEVTIQEKALLQKLEQSQKEKKPVAVTVNPLNRHILKVKGP